MSLPDTFESSGELVYVVGSGGEARLGRATSGRLIRSARRCSGEPEAALAEAATACGVSVRLGAMGPVDGWPLGGGFVVSIRRDDRERFEETMDGILARWVGETGGPPGARFA